MAGGAPAQQPYNYKRVFQIKLKNLKAEQFNGQIGTSDCIKGKEGRYTVELAINGVMKKVSVERQNIEVLEQNTGGGIPRMPLAATVNAAAAAAVAAAAAGMQQAQMAQIKPGVAGAQAQQQVVQQQQ